MHSLKTISIFFFVALLVTSCGGGDGNTDNKDRVRIVFEESYELTNLTLEDLVNTDIVADQITNAGTQSRSEFSYDSNENLKTIERYSLVGIDSPILESVTTHTNEIAGGTLISSNIKTEYYDNFSNTPYIDFQYTYQEFWEQGLIEYEEANASEYDSEGTLQYTSDYYRDYFYNDQAQLISIEGTNDGDSDVTLDFFYDVSGRTDRYELTFFGWDSIYTTSYTYNEKGAVTSERWESYDTINDEVNNGQTTFYSFDKDLNVMISFSLQDFEIEDGYINSTYVYIQYFEETEKCDAREEASKQALPLVAVPYCLDRNIY